MSATVFVDPAPTLGYLPCCVEGPAAWLPKAAYALRMLLLPLGWAPRWVDRLTLKTLGQGVYYGPAAMGWPEGVLAIWLHETTPAYFASGQPYGPERVRWRWNGVEPWPVLFGSPDGAFDDPIASVFFWLSGWQEQVVPARDEHGRTRHADSLQAALGIATRPPVEATRAALARALAHHGISVRPRQWQGHRWAFCPTIDVDYLRKWRPGILYREFVLYPVRNLRQQPLAARLRRLGEVIGELLSQPDPFRVAFWRIVERIRPLGTGTFFFKAGATSAHDVRYRLKAAHRWVHALQRAGMEVGLHPSYHAAVHREHLERERHRLAALLDRPLLSVRTHYLRWMEPATPRLLAAAGFRIDSTLGWPDHEGFRRGTCLPFQLFDVQANAPLPLWELPLAVMESVLFVRRGLTPTKALRVTETLLQTCRQYGGVCVALWHTTLWDERDFPGWGAHFEQTLQQAAAQEALIVDLRSAIKNWR
ncbi:polysaccharide deacetylase family protein [Rhodothermus profundi]|uniref:DUF7033 domain-containing protein n=1 Tax=Rhodothermus profundi TaxID=633813 RepID=A0A1M6PAB3_9BACT|nr:polysaccharide deacetylase family protein [Rhodothermus profundi]SHK04800.1 hypothetical protein SAMN04488087_0096 [Rhodothermus profundi]